MVLIGGVEGFFLPIRKMFAQNGRALDVAVLARRDLPGLLDRSECGGRVARAQMGAAQNIENLAFQVAVNDRPGIVWRLSGLAGGQRVARVFGKPDSTFIVVVGGVTAMRGEPETPGIKSSSRSSSPGGR